MLRSWEVCDKRRILFDLVRDNPEETGMRLDIELHHGLITRTMHAANRDEADADATMRYVSGLSCVSGLQKSLREAARSTGASSGAAADKPKDVKPRKKASKPRGGSFQTILTGVMEGLNVFLGRVVTEVQERSEAGQGVVLQFRGPGTKEMCVQGSVLGRVTVHQLPGLESLSEYLANTVTNKLRDKLQTMDDAGKRQIQEVIERGFGVVQEVHEGHFWSAKCQGIGFSTIIQTGGSVQSTEHRSLVRKFVPDVPTLGVTELLNTKLPELAEACAKLLGFSRRRTGVSAPDKFKFDEYAALSGDDESEDEDDDHIRLSSNGKDAVIEVSKDPGAKTRLSTAMDLEALRIVLADKSDRQCNVVSDHLYVFLCVYVGACVRSCVGV